MRHLLPIFLLLTGFGAGLFSLSADAWAETEDTSSKPIISISKTKKPYKDLSLTQMIGLQPMSIHDTMPDEDIGTFFNNNDPYDKLRHKLNDEGVNIDIFYWPEFMANVAGGLKQEAVYAHDIGIYATFDLEKLFGFKNTSIILGGSERVGRYHAGDVFADNVYNTAQIYGAGGNVAFHLIYFYLQKTWLNDRIRWIIGRYATGLDYDASMLLCSFNGLTVCNQPRITTTINGYSAWPTSSWGTNIKIRPTKDTYIIPGIFTSEPLHGGTAGTNWYSATGVALFGEAGWEPEFGKDRLNGHYKIGIMWDSSSLPYNWSSRETGVPGTRHGQTMAWIMIDQMILRHGNNSTSGLLLLGGFTHLTSSVSMVSNQWYAGLLDFGLIPSRPLDGFGVLYTKFYYGKKVEAAYQPVTTSNRNLAFTTLDSLVQQNPLMSTHESVLELIYRFHVTHGMTLTPEFQYLWRPGGTGKIRNSPIVGFDMRVFF